MQKIGILGSGISGLSLGWYLKRSLGDAIEITIFDKQDRVGGWINTIELDNFLFELGPRGCRPKGKGVATLQLIEELGLENEVVGASKSSQIRYLYLDGKLQKLPTSFLSSLFSPLMKGCLPALMKEWFVPVGKGEDETIYSFISRRLGPDIANKFIDPMTLGIYAGNINELSIRACFPKLFQWEKEKGSILKGMLFGNKDKSMLPQTPFQKSMQSYALFSFQNGMKTLTDKLAQKLDCKFVLNANIESLKEVDNGINVDRGINVKLQNEKSYHFDHLFSTLAPSALAPYLPTIKPLLNTIPSKSIVLVNVGFSSNVLKNKGFGYLIPSREHERILGAVWDSSTFPQQNRNSNQTRLTFMMNQSSNDNYLEIVDDALKRHLGIHESPSIIQIHHAKEAIPQYLVGHTQITQKIEEEVSRYSQNLTLLGTAFYGAGVNDCVFSARNISQIFCKKNEKRNTIEKKRTT